MRLLMEIAMQGLIVTSAYFYVTDYMTLLGSLFPFLAWVAFIMSVFMLINYNNPVMQKLIKETALKIEMPIHFFFGIDLALIVWLGAHGEIFFAICFMFSMLVTYILYETRMILLMNEDEHEEHF